MYLMQNFILQVKGKYQKVVSNDRFKLFFGIRFQMVSGKPRRLKPGMIFFIAFLSDLYPDNALTANWLQFEVKIPALITYRKTNECQVDKIVG